MKIRELLIKKIINIETQKDQKKGKFGVKFWWAQREDRFQRRTFDNFDHAISRLSAERFNQAKPWARVTTSE